MIRIHQLLDNTKCFETIRTLRWPEAVSCLHCGSDQVTRQGKDDTQPERQCYGCKACQRKFDDLTDTVFAGHHQPLTIWVLCLYFMGLNLSILRTIMFTEFMIELFYSRARCKNRRIAGYVTVFAPQLSDKMADQKTENVAVRSIMLRLLTSWI